MLLLVWDEPLRILSSRVIFVSCLFSRLLTSGLSISNAPSRRITVILKISYILCLFFSCLSIWYGSTGVLTYSEHSLH